MSFGGSSYQPPPRGFSAADAYASNPGHAASGTSSPSSHPTPSGSTAAMALRDSYYSQQRNNNAPTASHHAGAQWRQQRGGEDVESGGWAGQGTGAQGLDDDDDDDEEDWNVYDDFNNTRPLATAPEAVGLASGDHFSRSSKEFGRFNAAAAAATASPSQHTLEAYPDAHGGYASHRQSRAFAPTQAQRGSTLLSADQFGFDAQNSDPRRSIFAATAGGGGGGVGTKFVGGGAGGLASEPSTPGLDDGGGFAKAPKYHDGDAAAVGAAALPGAAASVDATSGIELITVPALGAEYTDEERKTMRRPYKRRAKRQARRKKAAAWASGEEKVCGVVGRKTLAIAMFSFCVFLAVFLYFIIPRVPVFEFNTMTPVTAVPNGAAMNISYNPTSFSMRMALQLRANNEGGWIPSSAYDLTADVTDITTRVKVGEGRLRSYSFPGRKKTTLEFPVDFNHVSLNATGDSTWQLYHNACGHRFNGVTRPTLNLGVELKMKIRGLIGTKGASTQLNSVECPFELQANQ